MQQRVPQVQQPTDASEESFSSLIGVWHMQMGPSGSSKTTLLGVAFLYLIAPCILAAFDRVFGQGHAQEHAYSVLAMQMSWQAGRLLEQSAGGFYLLASTPQRPS